MSMIAEQQKINITVLANGKMTSMIRKTAMKYIKRPKTTINKPLTFTHLMAINPNPLNRCKNTYTISILHLESTFFLRKKTKTIGNLAVKRRKCHLYLLRLTFFQLSFVIQCLRITSLMSRVIFKISTCIFESSCGSISVILNFD